MQVFQGRIVVQTCVVCNGEEGLRDILCKDSHPTSASAAPPPPAICAGLELRRRGGWACGGHIRLSRQAGLLCKPGDRVVELRPWSCRWGPLPLVLNLKSSIIVKNPNKV
ncbi:hypothetical protein KIL84_021515 [Mauremys mutica]|uniref:Uncharacterized protein n=1 Tax=Mauremys mutica TaxID=74926 RepID=A0A9D3X8C3_9SAUR|nr:hypothetical protein KIL84_021515 [Mauremys mutica]